VKEEQSKWEYIQDTSATLGRSNTKRREDKRHMTMIAATSAHNPTTHRPNFHREEEHRQDR